MPPAKDSLSASPPGARPGSGTPARKRADRRRDGGRCPAGPVSPREVAEPLEFLGEPLGGELLAYVQVDGLRVDARGQRPAAPLELRGDAVIEHGHDGDRGDHEQQCEQHEAALQLPAPAARGFSACHEPSVSAG